MLSVGIIGILLVIFKWSTSLGYQTFFLHTSHYTALFSTIKSYLITEKKSGEVLKTLDDLLEKAKEKYKKVFSEINDLEKQFKTCVGLLESQGLVRRLSFGNFVLLQPELLDSYASALVNDVRSEPDGLGSIAEEYVQKGRFSLPQDERLANRDQEKLLLIAMIEDLLRYEIVLREKGEDGPYLVFPSQSTRENPNMPDHVGKTAVFPFEGPIQNIYATLAVRLSHSGIFKKKELWMNAVTYTTDKGGTYGISLSNKGEGVAELTLFFDQETSKRDTYTYFEEYVNTHLQRRALSETIQKRRIFSCSNPTCRAIFMDLHIKRRRELGYNWIRCSVCDTIVALAGQEEDSPTATNTAFILQMDQVANRQREKSASLSTLQGKRAIHAFDVFLCHNVTDKSKVKEIGNQLKERGILPWLDEWELRPSLPWQNVLEKQIGQIKAAAVFIGPKGVGVWEEIEVMAFLREFARRRCPVIPVILENVTQEPDLPVFLTGMTWVDFRKQEPNPVDQLIWGITGERS